MSFAGMEHALSFLVLLGCASGFLTGLLGIGGGTVIVPGLIFILPYVGVTGPELPKIAMATSLALVVPTAISSAQSHLFRGSVDWALFALLGPGIVVGALAAAAFAHALSAQLLMALFVLFALYSAIGLMRPERPSVIGQADANPPGIIRITVTCLFGGGLASLLGLGVAFYAVPLMARFVALPTAIGTATILCVPMAIAGSIGYALADIPVGCSSGCGGYIYIPAVAAIGISAVLAAPVGAVVTHILPVIILRRLFGACLMFAALNLTYKGLPVAEGAREAQRLAAQLLFPSSQAVPQAANAPAWLSGENFESYAAVVTQYGPRREFLPLTLEASAPGRAKTLLRPASPVRDSEIRRPESEPRSGPTLASVPVPERAPRRSFKRIKTPHSTPAHHRPARSQPGDGASLCCSAQSHG
jgi:uncharacterized membrane protein YfcA